jgi:hypothetical protein
MTSLPSNKFIGWFIQKWKWMRILCKWTECTDLQRCDWYDRRPTYRRPVLLSACFTARLLILCFIGAHTTWPVCIRSEPQLFNRASNFVLFRFCKTEYNLTQMQDNVLGLAEPCRTQSFVRFEVLHKLFEEYFLLFIDISYCLFFLFLSLHRAFWRFTYFHIPTNAQIISFII